MIIARVARGVSAHFVTRLHEWIFAAMLIGMGLQLLREEVTFNLPIYKVMAQIADEDIWGKALIIVGSARFVALIVNGTFPQFHTVTPLFRSGFAFLSAFVWFALAWGFYKVSPAGISVILTGGLMLSDIATSLIVAREAGAADQRFRNGCRTIG
jgi:hypothetical protein